MKTVALIAIAVLMALIIPLTFALAQEPGEFPGDPPPGMEVVYTVMQVIASILIVPLVAWIKSKFIPDDLSFLSYVIQFALCFGFAALLAVVMVPGWTWMQVWGVVLLLMTISTGLHAMDKTRRNYSAP